MRTLYLGGNRSKAEIAEFLPQDFLDNFWSETELRMKEFIKEILEKALDCEAEERTQRRRYERKSGCKIYRNGSRKRKSLITHSFGEITGFKIPRLRGLLFESQILQRYSRKTKEFENVLLTMYINGQSCRRVKKTIKKLFKLDLSASSISAVLQTAQDKLDAWRKRKIKGEYEALLIDGVHINLRVGLKSINSQSKRFKNTTSGVVIAVMGIRSDGAKEILGFKVSSGESHDDCFGLLNSLYENGLRLKNNAPVIHDGAKGISSAAQMVFPYNPHQLCVFHFFKGVEKYIKNNKEKLTSVQKELSYIYSTYSKPHLIASAVEDLILKLSQEHPDVSAYLSRNYHLTLTYLQYPKEWQSVFKTNNYIERTFRQINRKIYDVGVFPNLRSAERILFLQILEENYRETGEKPFYA